MNTQDNITQVYQDAFKDFAVEAPASVQAGALRQLGRKSLLTLDPTRLNVFYMALISGAIAWAIIGTNSDDLAQEKTQDLPLIENTQSDISQVKPDVNIGEETENLALQSAQTTLLENETVINSENSVVTAMETSSKSQKNTWTQVVNDQSNIPELFKTMLGGTGDGHSTASASDNMNSPELLAPIKAELEGSLLDKIDVDPISLSGAKVQRAKDLLRKLKLDTDGKVTLPVYTGK